MACSYARSNLARLPWRPIALWCCTRLNNNAHGSFLRDGFSDRGKLVSSKNQAITSQMIQILGDHFGSQADILPQIARAAGMRRIGVARSCSGRLSQNGQKRPLGAPKRGDSDGW
jgi:hypothetical protein